MRTSWVYAPWGTNFPTDHRQAGHPSASRSRSSTIRSGRPTSAEHLARVSLALMQRGCTGAWHVSDGGRCSWFDMACFIVERIGASCSTEACATDEFPRPAPRPAYSVLDLSETEQRLGPMPPWQHNLADVLRRDSFHLA